MRLYPLTTHRAFAADLTVFAAASLKEALDEASVSYHSARVQHWPAKS